MRASHCSRASGPRLTTGVCISTLTSGSTAPRSRFGAGALAALLAECVFVALEVLLHSVTGKSPLDPLRMPAVLVIGSESLPASHLIASRLEIGILLHVALSILVGVLYAASVQRLGIGAISAGVATGLILYLLAFYVFPLAWPAWFADWNVTWTRKAVEALTHGGYGFVLGLAYGKMTSGQTLRHQ
jgi:hypothetical protein